MIGLPDEVAGILGLTLGNFVKPNDVDEKDYTIGSKFVDYLRMAGAITDK